MQITETQRAAHDAHTARRERMGYPCALKQPIVDLGAYFEAPAPIEPDPIPEPEPDGLLMFHCYQIRDLPRPDVPGSIEAAKRIVLDVAIRHRMTVGRLLGPGKAKQQAWARFELFYRLFEDLGWGVSQIGRWAGDRHHTTVMNGIKKHRELLERGEMV